MDEGRKRAGDCGRNSRGAAPKESGRTRLQIESARTESLLAERVRWAHRIMRKIDGEFPSRQSPPVGIKPWGVMSKACSFWTIIGTLEQTCREENQWPKQPLHPTKRSSSRSSEGSDLVRVCTHSIRRTLKAFL